MALRERLLGAFVASWFMLVGGFLVAKGFELSFRMCAYGGCSEPIDETSGDFAALVGFVILFTWPWLLAKVTGRDHTLWTIVLLIIAIPAMLMIGQPLRHVTDSTGAYLLLPVVVITASAMRIVPPGSARWASIARVVTAASIIGLMALLDGMNEGETSLGPWMFLASLVAPAFVLTDGLAYQLQEHP